MGSGRRVGRTSSGEGVEADERAFRESPAEGARGPAKRSGSERGRDGGVAGAVEEPSRGCFTQSSACREGAWKRRDYAAARRPLALEEAAEGDAGPRAPPRVG